MLIAVFAEHEVLSVGGKKINPAHSKWLELEWEETWGVSFRGLNTEMPPGDSKKLQTHRRDYAHHTLILNLPTDLPIILCWLEVNIPALGPFLSMEITLLGWSCVHIPLKCCRQRGAGSFTREGQQEESTMRRAGREVRLMQQLHRWDRRSWRQDGGSSLPFTGNREGREERRGLQKCRDVPGDVTLWSLRLFYYQSAHNFPKYGLFLIISGTHHNVKTGLMKTKSWEYNTF